MAITWELDVPLPGHLYAGLCGGSGVAPPGFVQAVRQVVSRSGAIPCRPPRQRRGRGCGSALQPLADALAGHDVHVSGLGLDAWLFAAVQVADGGRLEPFELGRLQPGFDDVSDGAGADRDAGPGWPW